MILRNLLAMGGTLLVVMIGTQVALPVMAGEGYSSERAVEESRIEMRLVRRVQQAFLEKGYSPGEVDGLMGPMTRAAISAFQKDQGWEITGGLGPKTLNALTQ